MRSPDLKSFLLLPAVLLEAVVAQSTTQTSSSASSRTSSAARSTITTAGVNRITYNELPSCASSCVSSAVRSIPCAPFVASCFCALPTGRLAYELPVECVKEKCGGDDIEREKSWRESICQGFTGTTTIGLPDLLATASSSSTARPKDETCGDGWKACAGGLHGGCCPSDNNCNLLDCQPPASVPTPTAIAISSPSEVPLIDVETLFPACSHECIARYLPRTPCGLSPLNSTCFCRLHDFHSCLTPCSENEINTFVTSHIETCQNLWYFTPFDPLYTRWCDLVEDEGKRGRPAGYDARLGSLEGKCPDWWEQRSDGKRFGIVLGIGILCVIFIVGCLNYWVGVRKRVTEIDKLKAQQRMELMGIKPDPPAAAVPAT